MSKFYLIIFLCSGLHQECNVISSKPFEYNSYYKCIQEGYGLSYELLFAETPKDTIEDNRLFTKFSCKETYVNVI